MSISSTALTDKTPSPFPPEAVVVTICANPRRYPTVFEFAMFSEMLPTALELARNPLTPV